MPVLVASLSIITRMFSSLSMRTSQVFEQLLAKTMQTALRKKIVSFDGRELLLPFTWAMLAMIGKYFYTHFKVF